ncbi:MAG TPA: class I SAM-dependent methyltransferase [Thermoanaerobaculia bacterium]|nr:class I SAM-dependent methyltransferase [Thermoanaerobaculia bacterium]
MREPPSGFDAFAQSYDEALNRGIRLSGEGKEFFATGRIAWTRQRLGERAAQVRRVLDFGCGTGTAVPILLEAFPQASVLGVDTSAASLEVARRAVSDPRAAFLPLDQLPGAGAFDLVYTNGVFHHIPPGERAEALAKLAAALVPAGYLAVWENNPWNPGTRWVMSRIPFDRDAIPLPPTEARARVTAAGLEVLGVDFLFFFPRLLSFLRPYEPWLARIPLGAQYLVLAEVPATSEGGPNEVPATSGPT